MNRRDILWLVVLVIVLVVLANWLAKNVPVKQAPPEKIIQDVDSKIETLVEETYKAGAERGQLLTMRWIRTNGMSFSGIPFMGELAWHEFTNGVAK